MVAFRIFFNLLARLSGFAMLAYSFYYGVNHEPQPIIMGVIHWPSLYFVSMGLLGITLASYQVEIVWRIVRNVITFSPTIVRNKCHRLEKILPDLTEIYYEKGVVTFLEEVQKRKMTPLWQFVATKLEARIPMHDIQLLVQNQAKLFNEGLFTQIRVLQGLATIAPAVGMTGTILGLIQLLKHLHDFEALGSNMALAFITALYGLLFGNFVFIPVVNRLNAAREEFLQIISQCMFWMDMVSHRKPSDYLDRNERQKITA